MGVSAYIRKYINSRTAGVPLRKESDMDSLVFVLMWVYGLIITASVSYLSFHVMESWVLRHVKHYVIFGVTALVGQLAGLTLFSYWATTLPNTLDAMCYTALFHIFSAGSIWTIKRCMHLRDLP